MNAHQISNYRRRTNKSLNNGCWSFVYVSVGELKRNVLKWSIGALQRKSEFEYNNMQTLYLWAIYVQLYHAMWPIYILYPIRHYETRNYVCFSLIYLQRAHIVSLLNKLPTLEYMNISRVLLQLRFKIIYSFIPNNWIRTIGETLKISISVEYLQYYNNNRSTLTLKTWLELPQENC